MPVGGSSTPRDASQTPCRVLLVEDSPEGRRSLARLLELHGFEVTAVANGASALRALEADPPPEIVLTDLMLPDIDGREVVRLAQALQPRPVVAVTTGYNLAEMTADSTQAPADHVFLKPLDIRKVVDTLRHSVEGPRPN